MKKKSKQQKTIKQQQKNFIQHWSPYDEKKQYTALQDPHANYYFYNKSVNKHLKQLKKAINRQKNAKQKQTIKQQIKSKLSAIKLPNIKISPKTAIYANEINKSMNQLPMHYRKKSQAALSSLNRKLDSQSKSLKKQNTFAVIQTERYKQMEGSYKKLQLDTQKNKTDIIKNKINPVQQKYRMLDQQRSKRITHNQFLSFLTQRRKKINENHPFNQNQSNTSDIKQPVKQKIL